MFSFRSREALKEADSSQLSEIIAERRSCARHAVHGPAFASFDGVTGGMILDLSEQGLSMQTVFPVPGDRRYEVRLDLPETNDHLETTGYIAWADALGRAGVRFSDLPAEARVRLDDWLAVNDEAPSRKAPKLSVGAVAWPHLGERPQLGVNGGSNVHVKGAARSVNLEGIFEDPVGTETLSEKGFSSATVQFEFNSLGSDLNAALKVISERARTLTRADGAAIALIERGVNGGANGRAWGMICRASVGTGGPPLGTRVDVNSGFSGECIRSGRALRCDNAETDARVDLETCRRLGILAAVAAPIRYERDVLGLVQVYSAQSFAFDEGDVAILERLAQTTILMISQVQGFSRR